MPRRQSPRPLSEPAARIVALVLKQKPEEAEAALQQMGADAIPVARELLESSLEDERRFTRRHGVGCVTPMLLTGLSILLFSPPEYEGFGSLVWSQESVPMSAANPWYEWLFAFFFLSIMPGIFVSAGVFVARYSSHAYRQREKRRHALYQSQGIAVRVLANRKEDARALGVLLEIVPWINILFGEETIRIGWDGLIRQLRRLRAEEARLLTKRECDILYKLLKHSTEFVLREETDAGKITRHKGVARTKEDVPVAQAILKAYRHIGDERALTYVQRLIEEYCSHLVYSAEGHKLKADWEYVQKAAKECLPHLQARVEEMKSGEQLLRASNEPTPAPDTLLRPAAGNTGEEPQQLLRASAPEEQT